MGAQALSLTTDLQDIPEALIPQLASRIAPMLMTSSQTADFLQYDLRIPFGRRKLCASRNGHCEGPPVFMWLGNTPLYLRSQVKEWARWEHPSRMLMDPWRDMDDGE